MKNGVVPKAAGKKAIIQSLAFGTFSEVKGGGSDAELVQVVGKATTALAHDVDAALALEALPIEHQLRPK